MRGQEAFEYLMTYGWGLLIVAIAGVVLYNLGVFSPTQASISTGFAYLKPLSVEVDSLSPNDAKITVLLHNIGGKNLQITSAFLNTTTGCTTSLVKTTDPAGNNYSTVYFWISSGQTASLVFKSNGTNCGKSAGQPYNYKVNLGSSDEYGITFSDSGSIKGREVSCKSVPTSGLVGLWKFHEGTGSTSSDWSGSSGTTNAVLGTGVNWTDGKIGYGVALNNINHVVQMTATGLNNAYQDYNTYLLWMKWGGGDSLPITFGGKSLSFIIYSNGCMGLHTDNSDAFGGVATGWQNNWVHLAIVLRNGYDSDRMPYSKIYVNGQLITAALCSGNGLGYRLAGDAINSGAPGQLGFNGSIDEIRAYNRELSASEVQAIYDCEGP